MVKLIISLLQNRLRLQILLLLLLTSNSFAGIGVLVCEIKDGNGNLIYDATLSYTPNQGQAPRLLSSGRWGQGLAAGIYLIRVERPNGDFITETREVNGNIVSLEFVFDISQDTPQLFLTNKPLTVEKNGLAVISTDELSVADTENIEQKIVCVLKSLPAHGTLIMNYFPMNINDVFKQGILSSSITYEHDGGISSTDNFNFDVVDKDGNILLTNQVFTIKIFGHSVDFEAFAIDQFGFPTTVPGHDWKISTFELNRVLILSNMQNGFEIDPSNSSIDGFQEGTHNRPSEVYHHADFEALIIDQFGFPTTVPGHDWKISTSELNRVLILSNMQNGFEVDPNPTDGSDGFREFIGSNEEDRITSPPQ